MKMPYRIAAAVLAACAAIVPWALAQPGPGSNPPPYGPGMMGGYGSGYGPGMMWGYGHGYGRGMMGGYGYGPGWGGMMGGYGPGMMAPYAGLDLSEQQRSMINQIQDEVRKKNWEVMGRLLDEQARLRDLNDADKRDAAAIGKQSMKIADLRRQMMEASVDAHNRMEALLSKEQKERLRRYGRGWTPGDE